MVSFRRLETLPDLHVVAVLPPRIDLNAALAAGVAGWACLHDARLQPADDRYSMTLAAASTPIRDRAFSDVLEGLGASDAPTLTLAEVVEAFGDRGLGALILVLSLMALFPWPPGGKAIFAAPIILLAGELAFQRNEVWLPRWALKASLSRAAYRLATSRLIKPIRWVENLTRPRLSMFTGPISEIIMGCVCVLLAVLMALPVPFFDMLPGLTLMLFSLGVMQKDGVAVLAGAAGTVISIGYLVLIWATVVEVGARIATWFGALFG